MTSHYTQEPLPTLTGIVAESGGSFDDDRTDFDLLLNALNTAGLAGALDDPNADLTVFAPTDAAFVGLAQTYGFEGDDEGAAFDYLVDALTLLGKGDPTQPLIDILLYHVSPGAQDALAVLGAEQIDTLAGPGIGVDPHTLSLIDKDPDVADPTLVATDIAAQNGIAHVIDGVLLPADLPQPGGKVDFVIGEDSRDVLFTGRGDDLVSGKGGDDVIALGGGDDIALGGDGADVIRGGRGYDHLDGGSGDDLLVGARGRDAISGGDGADVIRGGSGQDHLDGGAGNDMMAGNRGADRLSGGAGQDELLGGLGHDLLNGGADADILTGGLGIDTFAFADDPFDGADVSADGRQIIGNEDTVTDFDFHRDTYAFDAKDFGIGELFFAAADANADGADKALDGANAIVLLNADDDNDPETPFLAGTAANQIADLVDEDGAGFFVYWNSNLELNRLAYSENLNDASADLKIVSRQTDLTGQDAIDALEDFSASNFTLIDDMAYM